MLKSMWIAATGMEAQSLNIDVIANNLANVNTTRTAEGGPYKRRDVVFAAQPVTTDFGRTLDAENERQLKKVEVIDITVDGRPPKLVYDPHHPEADDSGYVALPNINVIEEMVNILSATRSYEANVAVVNATKSMVNKTLEIGR